MHILIIVSIVLAAIYCVPALAALAGELLVIAFVAAVIFAILGGLWMFAIMGGGPVLAIGAAGVGAVILVTTAWRKRHAMAESWRRKQQAAGPVGVMDVIVWTGLGIMGLTMLAMAITGAFNPPH